VARKATVKVTGCAWVSLPRPSTAWLVERGYGQNAARYYSSWASGWIRTEGYHRAQEYAYELAMGRPHENKHTEGLAALQWGYGTEHKSKADKAAILRGCQEHESAGQLILAA
jgi:hypothetical protein